MTNIEKLELSVRDLYGAKDPARDDWADWLAANHVFAVADSAQEVAEQHGARADLARAGGMLHDIADARMSRFDEAHEETSLAIARDLMQQAGFSEEEIHIVVDDGIRLHSCRDGQAPETPEGKALATGDARVHLQSDFYLYFAWKKGTEGKSLEELKQIVGKKIERDFHDKIFFEDVRETCRPAYELLRIWAEPAPNQ
ncbi:HDIG domain-containing protein [Candidatus Saccharibacteria bacterium]|nr:MAG: HDIG domain-containing protein [Candidatus Saccharibacteria bacterium]